MQTRSSTPKKGGTKHFEELPADGKPKRGSKAGASGGTKASPSPANAVPPSSTADFHWEFGGPIGGLGIMVGLPTVMYFLLFSCGSLKKEGASYCVSGPLALPELTELDIPPLHEWWSLEAAAVFLGWFAFQVALERLLPGDVAEGVKLKTGERLKYRLNGHLSFWISFVVLGYGRPTFDGEGGVTMGMFQLSWLYDHYLQLLTASVAFSFALSAYLYATSFGTGKLLAVRRPLSFLRLAALPPAPLPLARTLPPPPLARRSTPLNLPPPPGRRRVRQRALRLLHRPGAQPACQ